ncbi:MAG: bifunctional hydroxymethylpyrimidine kinase/phosphomethylpyrimidine kinase [Chloroflexi bacterium]|nr:bifunctional hydroxymethylpyrimidine kinase/phosphomethylpyrimidine kinase [Chloroflexota bacterium]
MAALKVPKAMTIAGSDSGGGAGIQADLKTFSALGVYGSSTLTAITAQNTVGVTMVHEIPIDIIVAQIDAVLSDIGADAVKTGMLASSAIVETVAQEMERHHVSRLVVDPVMVAKSGDRLLREDAVEALRTRLIPLAAVVTPNIPEAEALTGLKIETDEDVRRAAEAIVQLGARAVVVKGGHREGPATDLFYDGVRFQEFSAPRIDTVNTHGTGCTFASAVAAGLAKGLEVVESVELAKDYVTEAIRRSFPVGHGHGPLHHFYKWWGQ